MRQGTEETEETRVSGAHVLAGLGRAIRLLRTERGLNRKELAERAELSYPYLSEIEAGKKQASSVVLVKVARALEVTPEELLRMAADVLARARASDEGAPPPPPASRHFHTGTPYAPPAAAADPAGDLLEELLGVARDLSVEDRAVLLRLARRLRA